MCEKDALISILSVHFNFDSFASLLASKKSWFVNSVSNNERKKLAGELKNGSFGFLHPALKLKMIEMRIASPPDHLTSKKKFQNGAYESSPTQGIDRTLVENAREISMSELSCTQFNSSQLIWQYLDSSSTALPLGVSTRMLFSDIYILEYS